jgi:hypothetical protein
MDSDAGNLPGGIATLRDGAWLNTHRVRAYAIMLLIAYAAMLISPFLDATRGEGSDFLAFWGAAKLTVAGTPQLAYDIAAETAVQATTGIAGFFAYVNPPPFLLVTAPLGMLPYAVAWVVWSIAGWAIWLLVARRILPQATLAIAAFPGAWLAASHAQNGFVTGALLIGGVLALKRSEALSGALFGALIVKPHLALLVPLWLLAGRKWTAIGAAAASALALSLLSLAVFGLKTWQAYPQTFAVSAAIMRDSADVFWLRMGTVYSAVRYHGGSDAATIAQALVTLACAALAVLVWRRTRDTDAAGALLLAATALGSPYLFAYDLAFLALPLFWLVREGLERGFRPWERLVLIVLYFGPLIARAAALPLEINLTPMAAAALVALVWSRTGTQLQDASGGKLIRIASILPPVLSPNSVPRS